MESQLQPIKRVLGANEEIRLDVTGNLFLVWSAEANVKISWDDSSNPGTYGEGQGYQLQPGERFKLLRIINTSAGNNTVTIFYGVGTLLDFQKEISISAASMTALAAAINASIELKLKIQVLAPNAAAVVFSNCKSLEVIASGAGGDSVNISTASGTNYNLPSGTGKDFGCETDTNHIEPVTVTPSATCGAEVTALYF
jgi:hypothetical protein